MSSNRRFFGIAVTLFLVTACAPRAEHVHSTTPPPNEPRPTTEPEPAVPLEASIASVTLADDCPRPATTGRFAQGYCRQSSVQLALRAPADYPGATLEVTEVRLLTMEGALVQTLTVSHADVFRETGYVRWDNAVAPGEHNVALQTSGPDWATIDPQNDGYGQSFRLEVDVRAGAQSQTLEFSPAMRESMVVT